MKAKNTYNATQLNYLTKRIDVAVRRKQEELYEAMSARTKLECKKYSEVATADRITAITKAVLAKHPSLNRNDVVGFFTQNRVYYKDETSKALAVFGLKREDVDPELTNERKRAEIETRNGAEVKEKEKRLFAIKQEAMDAIYLADQSDLDAILKKLDSVSV